MDNYYAKNLGSQKLFQVYETQILRVKEYLQSEIDFVKKNLQKTENVLELGCGYGRILRELAPYCNSILGIDISKDSVKLGSEYMAEQTNAKIEEMDIHNMKFSGTFDVILCLQNGLSAMAISYADVKKILELLSPEGMIFFSTYSDKFWDFRIQWFKEQADKGLLGKVDEAKTKNGVIVCEDGFRAITYSIKDLEEIGESLGLPYNIQEIDESSVFLIIQKA